MKRWIILIFILVFLAFNVHGLNVELTFPVNNAVYVDSSNVVFKCKATGEDLRFIELYSNFNGWGKKAEVSNPTSNIDVTFSIKNISNGDYIWNCKAIDGIEGIKFSPNNRSFSINIAPNNAPIYKGGLTSFNWNMNTEKKNAFDLDDYFSDAESDRLSYTVNGNDNIFVNIDANNVVSFSQPNNWFGSEKISFAASDGAASVSSNMINLTVVKTTTSNPVNNSNSTVNTAPTLEEIPDQNVSVKTEIWFLDLINYAKDNEDSNSKLNWSVEGVNKDLIKVDIDNTLKRAKFTSFSKAGIDTINFVVSDSGGLSSSQSLKVIIEDNKNNLDQFNETKETDSKFYIKYVTPSEKKLDVKTKEIKIFKIETSRKGDVEWYLNEQLMEETRNFFNFNANEEGEYNLTAYVSDLDDLVSNAWIVNVKNELTMVASNTEKLPICGNNIKEENENCSNCPKDVKCDPGQICENNACVEKKAFNLLSITGNAIRDVKNKNETISYVVLGLFISLFTSILVIRRRNKSKYAHLTKLEKEDGFIKKIQKRLRELDKKRSEKIEHGLSLKSLESKSRQEILQTAPSNLSIIGFIKDSVAQGHSKNIIKSALKEKGWSRLQIWKAFRKI